MRKTMIAALVGMTLLAGPAAAKTLIWASQDDAATMDPHAFNHGMTLTVLQHIYEGLVRRDAEMRIEPALALSWTQPEPTIWRFALRPGVKFHDGQPFTADDVAFSFRRAMSETSDMKVFAASITAVKAVDPLTVDIVTAFPNAALIQSLPEIRIMSRAWSEQNNAQMPADLKQSRENYATRHANGTGPFRLKSRDVDVKTVLSADPGWWDKPRHNITEATMVRIAAPATRIAALLSGEVDFAYPVPVQDIDRVEKTASLKLLQGPEIRTMFLALDVARDELLYSTVKGRNPFKDRRVRQAMYQAIDMAAINARIMRGTAVPTGNMIAPGVNSVDPALQPRAWPYDVAAAKALMAEAGYAEGFGVTLDCPNDRYVNDERVCQALAGMLARIDIKVTLDAMPSSRFFPKIGSKDTSLNFFGYTPVNMDAYNTLSVMIHSQRGDQGQWNVGGYSNAEVDRTIRASLSEMDPTRRTALVTKALTLHREDIGHIPLYQQGIVWGMKKTVATPLQIDNRVNLAFFKVD
ncbi:MAG: ABC transporter substrate-binding protein [Alphaproteobacteria bacterium]|jgi:peptide/nickel transport system substrate-binding protein|nr:ABC transporter substrate-binding protein [Alphaproteobacteria bacterium]